MFMALFQYQHFRQYVLKGISQLVYMYLESLLSHTDTLIYIIQTVTNCYESKTTRKFVQSKFHIYNYFMRYIDEYSNTCLIMIEKPFEFHGHFYYYHILLFNMFLVIVRV